MKKRLGCLHAHYSNIDFIEQALAPFDIECTHFVDPALMHRVTSDPNFKESDAQHKVKEQLEWIAQSNVDAILITCTNYVALLQEEHLSITVPIIKIDEPYFDTICQIQQPQKIIFTNPATVEGTMERLHKHTNRLQKSLDLEAIVISDTFDLIMQGQNEEYNQEIVKFLTHIIQDEMTTISVAQLSMVDAARQVEYKTSKTIMNPLTPLVASIVRQMKVEKKTLHSE